MFPGIPAGKSYPVGQFVLRRIAIGLEAVRLDRQLGQEWTQVREYIDKGDYDKALALLLLSHE